jgi:hypothetical protein
LEFVAVRRGSAFAILLSRRILIMSPLPVRATCRIAAASRRLAALSLMICVACAAMVSPAVAAELRVWTDSTGKFKIKAKFLSLENGVVTLEKEDGTEMEIDIKKLSTTDQKAAVEESKADADNPFKPTENDPFKSKSKKGTTATPSRGGAKTSSGGQPKIVRVNWSSVSRVILSPPKAGWKAEVSSVDASAETELAPAPLPNKTSFFEGLNGIAISRAAKKAVVGYVLTHGKPEGVTRLVACDLANGQSGEAISVPGQMAPLALHDDGEQIVMRRTEFGFGNEDRLEVWTLDGSEVQRNVVWVPYDAVRGSGRDVAWADFIDEDRLATCSKGGIVVVWKFPEIRPMFTFTLGDGAAVALSPDRKLLAYCNGNAVGLFDLTKKAVIGHASIEDRLHGLSLAFSPSGKRLACAASGRTLIYDVATGKQEADIPTAGLSTSGGVSFPEEKYLLIGGRTLIDLENQVNLWSYEGAEKVEAFGSSTLFALSHGERDPGALVPLQLPHQQARDMLNKVKTDPDSFVIKPGTVVRINVSAIPDAAQRPIVEAALAKRLQEIECSTGPAGSIELAATVEGPKQTKVSFFHGGTHDVKEYWVRLAFVYQGKPAWSAGRNNIPAVIHLKEGENLEGYLRDHERPEYKFYEQVNLPKYVLKPTGKGSGHSLTLGTSKVTESGLQ